jgi:hypothetical protein
MATLTRRRRLFNNLLPSPLRGAITFTQMNGLSMRVREDLDLNMSAILNEALQHQRSVPKRAPGLTLCICDGLGNLAG